MVDKIVPLASDQTIIQRYRDLGDGTFAMVVSTLTPNGLSASSGVVANANATATLPATPGKTNYLTGFTITGTGATLAGAVIATLAGVVGGPLAYVYGAVTGALLGNQPLVVTFNPPLQATGVNVAISLTLPALGIGNANASVVLHGFQA